MKRLWVVVVAASALAGCKVEVLCAQGETLCGDRCISIDVDAENCGACGVHCGSHQECAAGSCTCAPGAALCGATCADTVTDPAHCGGCGTACAAGEFCRADDLGTGCDSAGCPEGLAACGHACVDHATDRFHCGACGVECRRGESCRGGACMPDLYVACFATDDVRPVNASLRSGIPQPAGDGPIALAVEGPRLHVANSLSHSVTTFSADLRSRGYERILGGNDLEYVTVHGGRVYVSNSSGGTLVVMDGATGDPLDEVDLGGRAGVNPRGAAFVGDTAFVALAGETPESGGQEIALVDFSGPRGVVTSRISVAALASPGALAFPTGVVAVGTKVYVTISNLGLSPYGYGYTDAAGPSKVAVIDTANGNALSLVDLGSGCESAGDVAAEGSRIWISCSWWMNPGIVPVDLSGEAPAVGAPVSTLGLGGPWNIAFCRGMGYVTDSWSGTLLRFDPSGASSSATAVVCPNGPSGWAFAADVACAP